MCIDEILQSAKEAVHWTASFLSIGLECVGLADESGEIDILRRIVGDGIVGLLLEVAVHGKSGTGRYELTDDDVFLKPDKVIDLALDGGLGKNLCGLLEGRCRKEALGRKGGLGDTHKKLGIGSLAQALLACLYALLDLAVCRLELADIDCCAGEQVGAAGLLYLDLAHHLADDDLDMLIVDINALLTVDLLNLLDDIGADTGAAVLIVVNAADTQDIVRAERAAGELLTLINVITVLDQDSCRVRHGVYSCITLLLTDDAYRKQSALLSLFNGDRAGYLRKNRHLLGLAGLEQLLDTGKTLGDIVAGYAAGVEGTHG